MKKNAGFTLIEVLIAMVVLAVGLLGLAALQATSLRNNQSAYFRSQAVQFSYNIADRIRANKVEALKGSTGKYLTTAAKDANQKADCTTKNGNCTPVNMAENDLAEWYNSVTGDLPNPSAGILFDATGNIFTITLQWDEDRNGIAQNPDPTFRMSFKL